MWISVTFQFFKGNPTYIRKAYIQGFRDIRMRFFFNYPEIADLFFETKFVF